ncbi:MAG: response regulator [Flavobacteriaceae bacterium]
MLTKNQYLVIVFFVFCTVTKAQVNRDSLWSVWSDKTLSIEERLKAISIYHYDERGFYKPENQDSAFHHATLQYELAKTHNLKKWMANAKNAQGNFFRAKNDQKKANQYFKESIAIAEEINDKDLIAKSSYNMGLDFFKQSDFEQGVPLFKRAAKLFEELGNKRMQAHAISMIGMMYIRQREKRGLSYLIQALEIREELIKIESTPRDRMIIVMMKKDILWTKQQFGIKDSVPQKNTSNLNTIEDVGLSSDDPVTLLVLGEKHLKNGNLKKAAKNFKKCIQESKIVNNDLYTMSLLKRISDLYFSQKEYTKSLSYSKQALTIAKKNNVREEIGQNYFQLFRIHEQMGRYKKALEMFQSSIIMRDSVKTLKNEKAVIQQKIQTDYENQKAIDDLENQKEIAIQEAKTKAQQRISWAIGIGLLLISILAFVIFNRLKLTRQQKAIIEEQKQKVEQSEKYKEQFLANMSHEIRTPMHAISGMTKILERNEHPPTQDVFLKAMRTSSDNLVVILNDVLDLSKIEAGKLEIENTSVNLSNVLENVIQILRYKAEEKGLILSYTIAEDVPPLVMGDPTRLNQILVNLIGNAIKFTEKGTVAVSLQVENKQLLFEVKDTGIGIPKNRQEHIFEAFEQAKESTSRYYSGTGLGLSISKQLVELQQGKIWLVSVEGEGSNFYFKLPLSLPDESVISKDVLSEEKLNDMAASLKGIRILIAEDNPFNQMIAKDDLSFYIKNSAIEIVENGALAVEQFKENQYDLILMDVQMPEMNGFEATKKIRELEKQSEEPTPIPIIAMTASLLKTEIENCYRAGMNDYIPKPYTLEELIAPIYKAVKP